MQEGCEPKVYLLGVWFLEGLRKLAVLELQRLDWGSQHRVRRMRKGFIPPCGVLPPPLQLLWPHLGHVTGGGHWRQPQPQRGDEAAAALPAPAQLSLRKGDTQQDAGEESALQTASSTDPRSQDGHSTLLTWQLPREFGDRREKGEACREHQRMGVL